LINLISRKWATEEYENPMTSYFKKNIGNKHTIK